MLTVDMYVHYKRAKTFQSSLSCYDGVDKENRIAVIALHKCRIERTHNVFVYHTVKLFLDTGGISDRIRSG